MPRLQKQHSLSSFDCCIMRLYTLLREDATFCAHQEGPTCEPEARNEDGGAYGCEGSYLASLRGCESLANLGLQGSADKVELYHKQAQLSDPVSAWGAGSCG